MAPASLNQLQTADQVVAQAPLVGRAFHLQPPEGGRPWLLAVPDRAALDELRIVNIYEALRFRAENAALQLPVELRFCGVTVARSIPSSWDSANALTVDKRAELLSSLGLPPPRSIQFEKPEPRPLPNRWKRMLGSMVARRSREELHEHTSLEFDLGMDSLDRLSFLIGVGNALSSPLSERAMLQIFTLGDLVAAYEGHVPPREGASQISARAVLEPGPQAEILETWVGPPTWSWPLIRLARLAVKTYRKLRMPVEVIGLDNVDFSSRPLILLSNHQAHVDAATLLSVLPARVQRRTFFLGFSGYFMHGWGRVLSRLMRICPISADDMALSGLRTSVAALNNDQVLAIYPEGERTWNGAVQPFRRGVAWLAQHTQATVVPMAIVGTYCAWPRGGSFQPRPVKLVFGQPIEAPDGSPASEREFLSRAHRAVSDLVRQGGGDPEQGYPLIWSQVGRAGRGQG